jgi:hypothetical protein
MWKSILALTSWIPCFVVAGATGVFTYHNDVGRTGQNVNEVLLSPDSVNSTRFGKLFSHVVDGDVYAQPLYFTDLSVPGRGVHNAVIIATEGDGVYAFDADSGTGASAEPLWHVSLIDTEHGASAGASTVSATADVACAAIAPQVGITATPAIDPARSTLYVEAFSKEHGVLVHRLHALELATGAERRGSPVEVTVKSFNPVRQLERAAVLFSNNVVYLAYGSHCDKPRFSGWLLAYDARTLAQKSAFATGLEHGKAAIWMSGSGPAADRKGNVFLSTGDGWFDEQAKGAGDLGDSILKFALRRGNLRIVDYFTPYNQAVYARHDGDLGSGGVLLLPDQAGRHPHRLVEAGKPGTLYVLDRDTLTAGNQHFCSGCASDTQIVQALPDAISGGVWGAPAYWNQTLYFSGSEDVVRAFSLRGDRLDSVPASASRGTCEYPGCGLSISADGNVGGVLWSLQVGAYELRGAGVLRAYDARDLAHLLYASDAQGKRDEAGGAVKFSVPTVINGKVFVGGAGQLTVFGLFVEPPER